MRQVHITSTGKVKLLLPKGKEYKRTRTIGQIFGDTYIVERSENDIMRVFNGSIGFNYEILQYGKFKYVEVCFPSGKTLRTYRLSILDYGHFLHFKANFLEKQIFLSLSDFEKLPKTDRPKYKNERAITFEEDFFG